MGEKLKEKLLSFGILKMAIIFVATIVLLAIMFQDIPLNQSWSAWSLPLSGKVIVVDAGHGGKDGGAESADGTYEKDINLKIAKYLQDYLNEVGALVIMTRESDVDLASEWADGVGRRKLEDLQNRVQLVNDSKADFFVSIHLNSIPSAKWHGAQTFYYPVRIENENMAKVIQQEMTNTLKNTDRKPYSRNDIIFLKYSKIPSVLIEAGFLSNPSEASLLKTEEYQRKVAFSIYQGISKYYATEQPKQ